MAEEFVETKRRSHILTLLMAWFLGVLGIHRFYTGYVLIGIIQLLTAGGFGIWILIDVISIVFNKYKDADGNELEGYNPGCGMIAFIIIMCTIIVGGLSAALKLFPAILH